MAGLAMSHHARLDAKQLICTVLGAVFGVALVFLVGMHVGSQFEDNRSQQDDADLRAASPELVTAEAEESTPHYQFFELLDAPAPMRELPPNELPLNPALEEKNKKREEKRAKAQQEGQEDPSEKTAKRRVERAAKRDASPAPRDAETLHAPIPQKAGEPAGDADSARQPEASAALTPASGDDSNSEPVILTSSVAGAASQHQGSRRDTAERAPSRREAERAAPPAPDAATPDMPQESAESVSKASFTVQVSAFQEKGAADAFADGLRSKGYPVKVKAEDVPGRGRWYRVRVGKLDSKDAATALQRTLVRKEGLTGFVTTR